MRNPTPYSILTPLSIALLILFSPTILNAQGQIFSECEAWEAVVDACGTRVGDDFVSILDRTDPDNPVPFALPGGFGFVPFQQLAWGELSQSGNDPDALLLAVAEGENIPLALPSQPVIFTPNGMLGPLQGFCFVVRGGNSDVTSYTFNFYDDSDSLVETHTIDVAAFDADGDPELQTIGWVNTDGLNISRFEFSPNGNDDGDVALIGQGQLAFGDGCDPPVETCFEGMAAVKADIEALLATSIGADACYLEGALDCVCWMQSDCFWEQPSGNRLSQYGGSMFIGAAYTVCYLEWVDDPQSDVIIDDLLNVLECIVDNEIAYAIANGGNQCYIDRAEDFADLGEIIDEDFDNQVVATLAYRLAWLHAYYSTY